MAILLESLKGAEVNVCRQSGIFNWKALFVFCFSPERKEAVLEIQHVFVPGEVGDGRYVR